MDYVSSIERIRLEQKLDQTRQEVETGMLSRLLTRRFGDLSQELHSRIKNATHAQIEIWFDRGMDATTLDAVFQEAAH